MKRTPPLAALRLKQCCTAPKRIGETVKRIDGSRVRASNRKVWNGDKAFYLQREASSCSSTFFFVCPTYSPVRFRPEVSATGNAEAAKHQTRNLEEENKSKACVLPRDPCPEDEAERESCRTKLQLSINTSHRVSRATVCSSTWHVPLWSCQFLERLWKWNAPTPGSPSPPRKVQQMHKCSISDNKCLANLLLSHGEGIAHLLEFGP